MRGRRLHNNDDVNGEVDANFWAQAAADQAAGRARGEDGDESKATCPSRKIILTES